jgi:hypothetical protein
MKVLMHALAASCEELRARTGNPPLGILHIRKSELNFRFLAYMKYLPHFLQIYQYQLISRGL